MQDDQSALSLIDYGLSAEQARVMLGPGNLLLTACPGSGKTYAVAGRAAWLEDTGKCCALLSHTNTGAMEIEAAVTNRLGQGLKTSHFVGTVHTFLARYILAPFGHLVTGAERAVLMSQDAVTEAEKGDFKSVEYKFTLDGRVVATGRRLDASTATLLAVRQVKRDSAREGVVSYDDALYWSYRVLIDYPDIARAVASRFDELLIDEAQDSNELQLACIRTIHEAGLKSLVLVGDFDQCIYAFGGATPDICDELATERGLRRLQLRENYRSSQAICNVTHKFRGETIPDRAVGEAAAFGHEPRLRRYDLAEPEALVSWFERGVDTVLGTKATRSIITRGHSLRGVLSQTENVVLSETARLLLDIKASEGSTGMRPMRSLDQLLLRYAFGSAGGASHLARIDIRASSSALIGRLPPLRGSLQGWVDGALAALGYSASELNPNRRSPGRPQGLLKGRQDISVMDALPAGGSTMGRIDTVHNVKGESIDAVLLVAAPPLEDWHMPEAVVWASALDNSTRRRDMEETRICYVGLTRARKILVLAVPRSTDENTWGKLQTAGFRAC